MQNISESNVKKSIFLLSDEFERILHHLFNDIEVTYSLDGMSIDIGNDSIDTDVLHDRLARYFDVEKVTSVHIDDCDMVGVWITFTGDSYPTDKTILNTETLPEFKGQIVDIFEDYFEELKIDIPCSDKIEAVNDGEDPDGLAIIYGEDYDTIADTIDSYISAKKSDNMPIKFDAQEMRAISGNIVDNASTLLQKITNTEVRDNAIARMNKDKKELRHRIADTFSNWNLYGNDYYVTHRVEGRYHTEVHACSIEDAIKKSDFNFSGADFGELECIDSYANIVEDETGNVVWDKA